LRGVSAEQDGRFKSTEKKLLARMKFPPEFATKVDMRKVNLDILRPWVAKKVTQFVGLEDDIITNMVRLPTLLKEHDPDPRKIQINLTGFLERNTPLFMSELWKLLISAQQNYRASVLLLPEEATARGEGRGREGRGREEKEEERRRRRRRRRRR
ncbi:hypothetical protein GUITHDRAFT_60382, partial [Guillardia theta CCMP2712]